MKKLILITITIFSITSLLGQANDNYSDELLSSSFKLYREADIELSFHIFPFLKERFIKELQDSTSFYNPYDSLAKQINIKHSLDGVLKTYTWEKRDSGCCHSSINYAQYKTKSGVIKSLDLNYKGPGYEEIFITDLQFIEIDNNPYYLMLGWGTCCGGKHYSTVTLYKIENETLVKCDTNIFNNKADLYIGANRGDKINLKYSPELKILSYNYYGELDDTGFYNHKGKVIEWKLKKKGFEKINL
ncbi:hypothetical protein H0I23_12960 [Cellulophaga sp. HaHaR_3_176]|uniref:hypothetical protein n=1 Tax=Cellulophaga sp. HaHaR_3_176 TaxID=1942464 RepID=UPI001C200E2B|nr:hypothetical protein [Cellulophaga sp. HaHaR_3_176]QWX83356.1 hypothetical protein H0I23_12960 [Cellulophaga sp. HaHaR_3_176]